MIKLKTRVFCAGAVERVVPWRAVPNRRRLKGGTVAAATPQRVGSWPAGVTDPGYNLSPITNH